MRRRPVLVGGHRTEHLGHGIGERPCRIPCQRHGDVAGLGLEVELHLRRRAHRTAAMSPHAHAEFRRPEAVGAERDVGCAAIYGRCEERGLGLLVLEERRVLVHERLCIGHQILDRPRGGTGRICRDDAVDQTFVHHREHDRMHGMAFLPLLLHPLVVLTLRREGGVLHAERLEDVLVDILAVRLAGDALDHICRHSRAIV